MSSREMLIAGNWKMHGMSHDITELIKVEKSLSKKDPETCVCIPATIISKAVSTLKTNLLGIGAQNCHQKASGAFTGDISAEMLKDIGTKYIITGHSERRAKYNESNDLVRQKAEEIIKNDMVSIICVGETQEEKNSGKTQEVVKRQVLGSLPSKISERDTVIAYEPVWAIGSGKSARLDEINFVHSTIRSLISEKYGETIANGIRILYGGSVNNSNAKEIFLLSDVDGALVGGASLKASDFIKIIQAAKKV